MPFLTIYCKDTSSDPSLKWYVIQTSDLFALDLEAYISFSIYMAVGNCEYKYSKMRVDFWFPDTRISDIPPVTDF